MPPHTPVLGQRYVRFTDHLRRIFGCRVHKVSIDAGFTCPNRDGTVAVGGCIYCNNASLVQAIGGCLSLSNSSKASAFCGNVMERKNLLPIFKPTPIPMVTYRYSRGSTTQRWPVKTSWAWLLAHAPTVCLRQCWIS